MTLQELVIKALKEQGYSGLMAPAAECGCSIRNLAPCESFSASSCEAAHWVRRKDRAMFKTSDGIDTYQVAMSEVSQDFELVPFEEME